MHITIEEVASCLGTLLTIVTIVAGIMQSLNIKLKYINAITTAIFAAEKAIDKATYNSDGTYNKAREDLAVLILSKMIPNFDDKTARADIEAVLAVVHAHAVTAITVPGAAPTVPPIVIKPLITSGLVTSVSQVGANPYPGSRIVGDEPGTSTSHSTTSTTTTTTNP